MEVHLLGRRGGPRRARRGHGRDRPGADGPPVVGASPGGRRAAGHLRPAVAAQGRAPGGRVQGAARRGQRLPARGRRRRGGPQADQARRQRLVLVHPRVQGRAARGARGRVHRAHVRGQPEQPRRGGDRRGRRGRAGHAHRHRGQGAARAGPGELDEVRGGCHAHVVRHVLGRRRRGRRLAGRRRRPAGDRPGGSAHVRRLHRLAALPQGGGQRPRTRVGGGRLMNRIKAFGAFWYDFVIGDDWRLAALVVLGLALTAILTHVAGVNAWWLLPVFVLAALAWSLHKATTSKSLSRTA